MSPIDPTPIEQVELDDLLIEYRMRATEPQTLGVRTRIETIEAEIRRRAGRVSS